MGVEIKKSDKGQDCYDLIVDGVLKMECESMQVCDTVKESLQLLGIGKSSGISEASEIADSIFIKPSHPGLKMPRNMGCFTISRFMADAIRRIGKSDAYRRLNMPEEQATATHMAKYNLHMLKRYCTFQEGCDESLTNLQEAITDLEKIPDEHYEHMYEVVNMVIETTMANLIVDCACKEQR